MDVQVLMVSLEKATYLGQLLKCVYTLHKPIPTRRVIVSHMDNQWQADLIDMQKYKQYNKIMNYVLPVIDIFSQYTWKYLFKRRLMKKLLKLLVRYLYLTKSCVYFLNI